VKYEIMILGRGGQGILLAGYILGLAAAKYMGYYVTQTEYYGAETRGGETRSEVVISDEGEICYPKVRKADIVILLYNGDFLSNYSSVISSSTIVLYDSILVKGLEGFKKTIPIPATKIAEDNLGTKLPANMVMLGALAYVNERVVTVDALEKAIRDVVRPTWLNLNLKAVKLGYDYVKSISA